MGGRGATSASGSTALRRARKALREYAKQGRMPAYMAGGSPTERAELFKEVDKLYPMPDVKTVTIADQGDAVWVNFGGSVSMMSYPSKSNATQAEKDGVLKFLLYNKSKR